MSMKAGNSKRHAPSGVWAAWAMLVFAFALLAPRLVRSENTKFTTNAVFTVSPLPLQVIREIIPLGNLNPRGGHVFPTDHVYFDYGQKPGLSVTAPAAGIVFAIQVQSGADFKIEIRVDKHLCYYLAHLYVEPDVRVGSQVEMGRVLGHASARGCLDLGAYDDRVSLTGFANPARYPPPTLHTISPLALFAEPLKTSLYAKVHREGADQDGKIDFDQRGRLVGNWFHHELFVHDSRRGGSDTWSKELAFIYDVRQPSAVRISIGGIVAPAGVYAVSANAPDPATVGVSTGVVSYLLLNPDDRSQMVRSPDSPPGLGVLLVQLVRESKLRAEYFPGKRAGEIADFTGAASIYER